MHLLAVDASPTALNEAARRAPRNGRIHFHRAILPGQMPRGPFDLIVVSELVYYLRPDHLKLLADRILRSAGATRYDDRAQPSPAV